FEDACDCLPDRRRHGRADAASYRANKLAKKLLEFLLLPDREQFGRQIHLAGFAEDLAPCVRRGDPLSCERLPLRVVLGKATEHRDPRPTVSAPWGARSVCSIRSQEACQSRRRQISP